MSEPKSDSTPPAPTRKPLTAAQKALAEKTIKLKYNGLIQSLKSATTRVENENEDLPLPTVPCEGHYGFRLPDEDFPVQPDDKWSAPLLVQVSELNSMLERVRSQNRLVRSMMEAERRDIQAENDRRRKVREEARAARYAYADQLAAERDNTILRVAFEGESKDMLDFLGSLPGPTKAMSELAALGFELAEPITDETGIGRNTPKQLNGPTSVSVSIE